MQEDARFGLISSSARLGRSAARHLAAGSLKIGSLLAWQSISNSRTQPLPSDMTKEALHTFLTAYFDLVIDPSERGSARSYFLGKVVWHPSATTRILHVQYGANDHVSRIKLCISSDNNNNVFVRLPMNWSELGQAVANEISLHAPQRPECGIAD
ncbi:hypothetical protein VSR82_31685 [Burkholderia sp. JPY481]